MKTKKLFKLVILIITITLLFLSCPFPDAGDGDNRDTPEESTDTVEPFVKEVSPPEGSTDVSISNSIYVTFSEPMNTASAQGAFLLSDGVIPVGGTFTWSGNIMTFDPNSDLSYNTIYYVTITTPARDTSDNHLASEFNCSFTTVKTPLTDAEAVALDKESLQIVFANGDSVSSVTQDLILPTFGLNGTTISWSCDNPSIVSTMGKVVRPATTTEVTLTAIITKRTSSDAKIFVITVLATTGIRLDSLSFDDPKLKHAVLASGKTYVHELTELIAYFKLIASLNGIEQLSNLTSIKMGSNQISELSPLASLTDLTYLDLSSNQISDISPLTGLTKLTDLSLYSNQINTISSLAGLTKLTDLKLYNNQINNVGPLSNLMNLTTLELVNNQIDDVSALSNLTKLTSLDLAVNQITNVNPLASLTNLRSLILANNQIRDVSQLKSLTSLVLLYLSINQIEDVSPLAGLINLEMLFLQSNPEITESSIDVLKAALPDCTIYWP